MTYELTDQEALLLDDCLQAFCLRCEEVEKSFNAPGLLKATYHPDRAAEAIRLRHKLWNIRHPKEAENVG